MIEVPDWEDLVKSVVTACHVSHIQALHIKSVVCCLSE